jgi:hypothetical protein
MFRSIFMGNTEVPTANQQVFKMPFGNYEFGANLISSKVATHFLLRMALRRWPAEPCAWLNKPC